MDFLKIMTETSESELLPRYKPELTDIVLRQSQKISQSVIVIKIG